MLDSPNPLFQVAELLRARPGHELVFLADTLMDQTELRRHCPSARFLTVATAKSRTLDFTPAGASIRRQPGSTVHGVLYEVPEAELAPLDTQMGHLTLRQRRPGYFHTPEGRMATGQYFEQLPQCLGPVDPVLVLRVTEIGRRLAFPATYLTEIRNALEATIH